MRGKEWYIEYRIKEDNKDEEILCLLKKLSTKIFTLKFTNNDTRVLFCNTPIEGEHRFCSYLKNIEGISIISIRESNVFDRLSIYYGWKQESTKNNTFCFTRNELSVLVEFMGNLFKEKNNIMIGIRGLPRVGKTEVIIAASVYAEKRWLLLSSTLQRQIVRNHLTKDELSEDNVYIIDGIISTMRGTEKHKKLVKNILKLESPKVIEHPDIFIRETEYTLNDFDYIIELRNNNENITYDHVNTGFSSFDIS